MGERIFNFRITAEKDIYRAAQAYNEAPALLSFFPSGNGEANGVAIEVDNPKVILSSVKKNGEGYKLTVYNASNEPQKATIRLLALDKTLELELGKCELKFLEI